MKQFFLNCFSVFFSRISLVVAVAAGLLSIAVIVFATDYTGIAGGGGGEPYTLTCGSGRALVGIKGKAGSFIDKVQGVCAQINYDGSWQGSTTTTGSAGGSTGSSFDLTCPSGYAVTGIEGKAANYIDNLRVHCQRIDWGGKISTSMDYWKGPAGGPGGHSFGPLICPDNTTVARLIKGKAATWVDSISLGCAPLTMLKIDYVDVEGNSAIAGNPYMVAVKMTLIPAATATVSLTSNNTSIATVDNSMTVGTTSQQGYATVRAVAPGCATIKAVYKGFASSSNMVVHGAWSNKLSLTTPEQMGSTATVTATIPSPAPAGGATIKLTSLDKLSPLGKDAVSMPASIVIPQGAVSIGFQITALKKEGCIRIKASGNGGEVTHAIMVQ